MSRPPGRPGLYDWYRPDLSSGSSRFSGFSRTPPKKPVTEPQRNCLREMTSLDGLSDLPSRRIEHREGHARRVGRTFRLRHVGQRFRRSRRGRQLGGRTRLGTGLRGRLGLGNCHRGTRLHRSFTLRARCLGNRRTSECERPNAGRPQAGQAQSVLLFLAVACPHVVTARGRAMVARLLKVRRSIIRSRTRSRGIRIQPGLVHGLVRPHGLANREDQGGERENGYGSHRFVPCWDGRRCGEKAIASESCGLISAEANAARPFLAVFHAFRLAQGVARAKRVALYAHAKPCQNSPRPPRLTEPQRPARSDKARKPAANRQVSRWFSWAPPS